MASRVVKVCRSAVNVSTAARQLRTAVACRRAFSDTEKPSNEAENNTMAKNSELPHPDNPYHGISAASFPEEINKVLLSPVDTSDVEIKPDGLIYLPEIKYRRILNQAFGPGGWALMPRSDTMHFENNNEGAQLITREYALYCLGRFVAQATGEHSFYTRGNLGYGKACESAKSNALMRCCKDLGIASELWDPQYVSKWKEEHAGEIWCENVRTKEKKKLWRRKDITNPFPYPWREMKT